MANNQGDIVEIWVIEIFDDDTTPVNFVNELLTQIFSKSSEDAEKLVNIIQSNGSAICGQYHQELAQAIFEISKNRIKDRGYSLKVELSKLDEKDKEEMACSFCLKKKSQVKQLIAGPKANICNECIDVSLKLMADEASNFDFVFIHELLNWFFQAKQPESITTTSRTYPERVRADLQSAVEAEIDDNALRRIGINSDYSYDQINIASLLTPNRDSKKIAPIRYEEVDIGETQPKKCLVNAIWLVSNDNDRYAILFRHTQDQFGGKSISIEIGYNGDISNKTYPETLFTKIENAIKNSRIYRGKILSLEKSYSYSKQSSSIIVHKLDTVGREDLILHNDTIELIDRSVIDFVKKRALLKQFGQSTKRGVLLFGPPGTGKTHTIRYLASQLAEHTTLLITAEQIGLLDEYVAIARLLQPSILVIEDADLIARSREEMENVCDEILLNKLLNEMDGLREDADILFLLTTNRPEILEDALANRPGRIDQAIEIDLPDDECRKRLLALYAKNIELTEDVVEEIVKRTHGVSASFIKELVRRLFQLAASDLDGYDLKKEDLEEVLADMIFSANKLNAKIIGANI